jgi:type II secretory pathway pseudopilin PulG
MFCKRQIRRNSSFTLVELVLVVTIIAVLAGFLIPQISQIGRSTDMAASARCQGDIAKDVQLYFTLQIRYPMYMDSLLVGTGNYTDPTGVYTPNDADGDGEQETGLPDSGPHLDRALMMEDLGTGTYGTGSYLRSLARSGLEYVMNHDRSKECKSNNSGVFYYKLQNGKNSGQVFNAAVIDDDPSNKDAQKIIHGLLGPRGIPTGAKLVCFGYGPSNSALGTTSLQAPVYPGCDGYYYGHYVVVLMVYNTGERASLAGVIDAYGRYLNYTIDQYNESLPNGARRG